MPRRLTLLLCLLSATAVGQSRYVSDELVITLRTGPSTSNQIITNLRSGDSVEVLEADAELGYSRVRVADGAEGWVLTRYLTAEPIAREELASSRDALAEARVQVEVLQAQVETLSEALETTSQQLSDADAANASMNTELAEIRDASANAVAMRDSNTDLRRSLLEHEQQLELLAQENRALRDGAVREWFVVGAGVLFGGIIIGLVLPSLRRKRRSEW